MRRGECVVFESDLKEDLARLGMESRSIFKSIQTEESKLSQSTHFTRSDLHYFRARHNYYRLSLLRLPADERGLLEPFLARFFEKIVLFERLEGGISERAPAPFLQSVDKAAEPYKVEVPLVSTAAPVPSTSLLNEVVAQLELIRLALTGESSSPEAKKVLCSGVDRIISNLKRGQAS